MNWLDFAIIATVVAGALLGMRVGFLSASIIAVGALLGMIFVGQVREDLTTWLANYISDETLATVFGYALTILVSVLLTLSVAIAVKTFVYSVLPTWPDRLSGFALGLVASIIISALAIAGMVDLVYSLEVPTEGLAKQVVAPPMIQATDMLAESLSGSTIVPKLIGLMDSIPTVDLDFVRLDFGTAAHYLEQQVN